jgi:signal transduction histidine kinase
MAHRLSDWNLPLPGRMPVSAAIGFTLAGISLISLRGRRLFTEFFAFLVFLGAYFSVIGYLYQASVLYDHMLAAHVVVLFALLGIALLCAAPQRILLGIVLSPYAGAFAARTMVWAIAVLLPLFRLTELWAETNGYVSVRYGSALSVLAAVSVFTAVALRTGAVLNSTDKRQRDTEVALIRSEKIAAAGRMAAAVAHEINNPLEAVGNILYLLKNGTLPSDLRDQYLSSAEEQLQRVAAIARRTLGFYKDETNPTEIDVPDLIDGVLNIYNGKLGANITLRRLYAPRARIFAKEGEIQQVISNLVSNAVDALADQGGLLEILVKSKGKFVTVVVRDDGHGIASDDLAHIFEPFFTKRKVVGTGLGLWVSKDLISRNGGTIEVVSSTGGSDHGTTFRLVFPAVEAKEPPMRLSAAESA